VVELERARTGGTEQCDSGLRTLDSGLWTSDSGLRTRVRPAPTGAGGSRTLDAMQSTLSPADRRAYEANLWRFVLIRVLGDLMLWFPIWVVYLQEMRGFSLTQVTLLEGPFWLAMVLAEVPTGAVADRWGRKLSLLLGGIVYAAAMVAFGTAETFGAIFISYLIWAVSSTLVSGADTAFLYESLRALGRGHELQRWLGRAYAGGVAATVAGVLIGAPLAAATSLATPIIASAAIAAIGVLVTLTLREPPHVLEDDGSGKPPAYHALIVRAARLTWHEPGLRSLVALRAVLFGAFILGVIFVQPFLTSFHVSIDQFGWLMALTRLAAIAGALVGARLVGHLGEGQVFVGATVVTVGSLVVLGLLPSLLAFAMFATLGFAQAVAAPAA
jgi:predicted MFS family arabinose efflux permease